MSAWDPKSRAGSLPDSLSDFSLNLPAAPAPPQSPPATEGGAKDGVDTNLGRTSDGDQPHGIPAAALLDTSPEARALLSELAEFSEAARLSGGVGNIGTAVVKRDPLLQPAAARAVFEALLPPGTPRTEVDRLLSALNELREQAAGAKPLVVDGHMISAAEALRSLMAGLASAAKIKDSSPQTAAPPTAAPPPPPAPPKPSPAPSGAAPKVPANEMPAAPALQRTPAEQANLRKTIDMAMKLGNDSAFEKLSHDKAAMALMSPAEKARAINVMIKGHTTDREDRAIVDILQSCKTREEFDEVVRLSGGGKKILEELDLGEAKQKGAMLFQMWGRDDCIPSKLKALAAKAPLGALLDPEGSGLLARGSDPASVDSRYGRGGNDMDGVESNSYDRQLYGELDPGTRAELMSENALRRSAGKPLLDHNKLQADLRAITDNSALDPKTRGQKVEELRKSYGLSPEAMRELGTRRMADATAGAERDLTAVYQNRLGALEAQLQSVVASKGEGSAEAEELRREIKKVSADAEQRLGRLSKLEGDLKKMFEIPPSFWQKLGKFVSDAVKVLGKVLDVVVSVVRLIPGVGTLVGAAYSGAKALISLCQGDWKNALLNLAGAAGPIGSAIGGAVGSAIQTGATLVKSAVAVGDAASKIAKGDVAGGLLGMAGGLASAGKTLGISLPGSDMLDRGAKLAKDALTTVDNITNGRWGSVLSDLKNAADVIPGASDAAQRVLDQPIVKEVIDHTRRGVQMFESLREGNLGRGAALLDQEVTTLTRGTALGRYYESAKQLPDEIGARVLEQAGALAQPILGPMRDAYALGEAGRDVYNHLRSGDLPGVLRAVGIEPPEPDFDVQGLYRSAEQMLGKPAIQDLVRSYEDAAPFVHAVQSGQYLAGLEHMLTLEPLAGLRGELEAARDAAVAFTPTFRAVADEVTQEIAQIGSLLPSFAGSQGPTERLPG
jgi:hypothetical protein